MKSSQKLGLLVVIVLDYGTHPFYSPRFENLPLVGKLDKIGFQVSTGSACSTLKDGGSQCQGYGFFII